MSITQKFLKLQKEHEQLKQLLSNNKILFVLYSHALAACVRKLGCFVELTVEELDIETSITHCNLGNGKILFKNTSTSDGNDITPEWDKE